MRVFLAGNLIGILFVLKRATRIGHYEYIDLTYNSYRGSGCYGAEHMCMHLKSTKILALKLINGELTRTTPSAGFELNDSQVDL